METSNKHNQNEYSYLRRIPIDKLLELLALAPVLSDKPEDEAYVSALEEAIIEKENEDPTGFFPDVDQQWEQFVTHYLPDQKDTALEPERTDHAVSAQINQQSLTVPPKRVIRFKRVWRTAMVAAIAVACMFAAMVTVQAAGVDVFGAIARWTEDVFSFGTIAPDSEVSDNPSKEAKEPTDAPNMDRDFASLQEALDAYGMTEVHEPSWLPEGYTLETLDVLAMDDPFLRTFSASYTDGEERVGIDIMSYEDEPIIQVQKNDAEVKQAEKNGTIFYLLENTEDYTIAWYTERYEYYLSSKKGPDVLWQIVRSMLS